MTLCALACAPVREHTGPWQTAAQQPGDAASRAVLHAMRDDPSDVPEAEALAHWVRLIFHRGASGDGEGARSALRDATAALPERRALWVALGRHLDGERPEPRMTPPLGGASDLVVVLPPAGRVGSLLAADVGLAAELELRRRGVSVVPFEVSLALLAQAGIDAETARPAGDVAAAVRALGAHAFLAMRVRRWQLSSARANASLDCDVDYQWRRAADGTMSWRDATTGPWALGFQPRFFDSEVAHREFLRGTIQPPAGRDNTNALEIARAVHRDVFQRLP